MAPPTQPPATFFTVVRHGETEWNALGRQQGQLDTPLTPRGVQQATAIATALPRDHYHLLVSSDLDRARRTAAIIGAQLGLPVQPEERLRERHLGALQGLTLAEFAQRFPAAMAAFRRPDADYELPGGESIRQRLARTLACLSDLAAAHPAREILVVTHAGVLDGLFRHTLGLPLAGPRRFSLLNGALNRFALSAGIWRLEAWGSTAHLGPIPSHDDW